MILSSRGLRHLRNQVIARARWRREYCRAPQAGSAYTFHLDHILPRAKGGTTVLENLALACASCNGAKRAKATSMFLTSSPFLLTGLCLSLHGIERGLGAGHRLRPEL